MSHIIEQLNAEQIKDKKITDFAPGDTVVVQIKVKEGNRERLQAFEGVVIAKRNRGINSAFTVRKISSGEGVERVFQTYSPTIDSITVKRRGDVRQSKLYYLRALRGKKARIKEKLTLSTKTKKAADSKKKPATAKAEAPQVEATPKPAVETKTEATPEDASDK